MTADLVGYPPGEARRRVHLRRHRRHALRREGRAGKGAARQRRPWAARAGRRAGFGPKPLFLPDRGRLAGHRARQRDRGADRPGQCDPRRRACEAAAREALAAGKQIAAIVATMGSTDAFGIDDLEAIDALRHRLVERVLARLSSRISMPTRSSAGPGACSTITTSRHNPLELSRPHRAGAGRRSRSHPAFAAGRFDRHRFS